MSDFVYVRRFWSVVLGGRAARISAYDAKGGEHYAIILDEGTGKERRARREHASMIVKKHITEGFDPGVVGIPEVELEEA